MNIYYKAFGIGIEEFTIYSLFKEAHKIISKDYGLRGKLFLVY